MFFYTQYKKGGINDRLGHGCVGSDRYGVVYQDNWLHHSRNDRTSKRGLRFDRAQHICSGLENNTVRCSTI